MIDDEKNSGFRLPSQFGISSQGLKTYRQVGVKLDDIGHPILSEPVQLISSKWEQTCGYVLDAE